MASRDPRSSGPVNGEINGQGARSEGAAPTALRAGRPALRTFRTAGACLPEPPRRRLIPVRSSVELDAPAFRGEKTPQLESCILFPGQGGHAVGAASIAVNSQPGVKSTRALKPTRMSALLPARIRRDPLATRGTSGGDRKGLQILFACFCVYCGQKIRSSKLLNLRTHEIRNCMRLS